VGGFQKKLPVSGSSSSNDKKTRSCKLEKLLRRFLKICRDSRGDFTTWGSSLFIYFLAKMVAL